MLSFFYRRKICTFREKIRKSRLGKTMDYSRFLKLFFIIFSSLMLVWFGFIFLIDPYIVWHRAVGYPQVFSGTYAMIPGILRTYSYDTVLVGSSLTKNTRISDMDRLLNVKAIKATASGAQARDCAMFMREAVNTGQVKRIILCVDPWSFVRKDDIPHYLPYSYLYGRRNWLTYVFSLDILDALSDFFFGCFAPADDPRAKMEKDPDYMFFDPVWRYEYSRQAVEDSICNKHYKDPPAPAVAPDALFEECVLAFVKKYPEIRFDLFLAPVSIWQWCAVMDTGAFDKYMAVRLFVAEKAAQYPNIYLHDLQAAEEVVCNIDNYCDTTHYSPGINCWIIEQIAKKPQGNSVEDVKKSSKKLRCLTEKALPDFHEALKRAGKWKEK